MRRSLSLLVAVLVLTLSTVAFPLFHKSKNPYGHPKPHKVQRHKAQSH